jgi:hypothetical protein
MPKVPALKARFIAEPFRSIIGAMPQSLSKVIIHIIFNTKNREPWLDSDIRPRLQVRQALRVGLTARRCVESRFQRSLAMRLQSWGVAPG